MKLRLLDFYRGTEEDRAEEVALARDEIADRVRKFGEFLRAEYMPEFKAGLLKKVATLEVKGPADHASMLFNAGKAAGCREVLNELELLERQTKELSEHA